MLQGQLQAAETDLLSRHFGIRWVGVFQDDKEKQLRLTFADKKIPRLQKKRVEFVSLKCAATGLHTRGWATKAGDG